jgi:hypothetical protein
VKHIDDAEATFYGDVFGKQIEEHSIGSGTCIKLNLEMMT